MKTIRDIGCFGIMLFVAAIFGVAIVVIAVWDVLTGQSESHDARN
jgi:hypothetical protein